MRNVRKTVTMRNVKKTAGRMFVFLLLGLLLTGAAQTAQSVRADSIAEPYESDFYQKHISECRYIRQRKYIAYGPEHRVILYEAPDSADRLGEIANGTEAYTEWLYDDEAGVVWAYLWKYEAWVPFDYLIPTYNNDSFREEFGDSIRRLGSSERASNELMGTEVYYFEYPGAADGYTLKLGTEYTLSINAYFTDEMGRLWGAMDYYYGVTGKWVCLDDPYSDFAALWPDGAPARNVSSDAYAEGRYEEPVQIYEPIVKFPVGKVLVIAAVLLAAAGTALIVITILKRRHSEEKDGSQEQSITQDADVTSRSTDETV